MTTRQPRRARRRQTPATTLPRPLASEEGAAAAAARPARHATTGHRTHHVTTDYRYVKKDLWHILAIGAACMTFIVGMALYIG